MSLYAVWKHRIELIAIGDAFLVLRILFVDQSTPC